MGVVAKIIAALAAILPAIVEWWAKRRAAQEQAAVEDRNTDIKRDPADGMQRKFNTAGQQPDSDNQTNAEQPKNASGWWNKHE